MDWLEHHQWAGYHGKDFAVTQIVLTILKIASGKISVNFVKLKKLHN